MIAKYYGKSFNLKWLREKSFLTREGVSMLGISDAAESIGFRTIGASVSFKAFSEKSPLPCIVHWGSRHFVVVYKINQSKIFVADPAHGLVKYSYSEFLKGWNLNKSSSNLGEESAGVIGKVLLLEPTPEFYEIEEEKSKRGFTFLFKYMRRYKSLIVQLSIGLLVSSIIQLFIPFLTQSIVDIGISQRNVSFVYLILMAQISLFVGQTVVSVLRNWILLHVSTRINIALVADFLMKLMKLPIYFFNTKMVGDIINRIQDHKRIEAFLTTTTLDIVFSFFNIVTLSFVLAYYELDVFVCFLIGSVLYVAWAWLFLKKRKTIDYKNFSLESENQNSVLQMISGIQEIKLNSCEKQKRWDWESIQAGVFRNNVKGLQIEQYQNVGSTFINEVKNVIISALSAKAVISGEMTLGMMLAIQFIVGQLNVPIIQIVGFIHLAQNAFISIDRLNEVHEEKNEEDSSHEHIRILPKEADIRFRDVNFSYNGPRSPKVLEQVSFIIPAKKVTAIVGSSGSGKTTLLKLLLRFYEPNQGEILLGSYNLSYINHDHWRSLCGAVLQDGFMFSDTIANNISLSDEVINQDKLLYAARMANIHKFIESLPLGYRTKIGSDGISLSQGQKQRVLIARVIYKNPKFIFLDEATNALDANNETTILENLNQFLEDRTVVVVAHRLNTIRNADHIVVLDEGRIVEVGSHNDLVMKKGFYYQLVEKQLQSNTVSKSN